ncbi:NEDD8 ultimate buster 1-like isoform X2 [Varroa jacobsoni]|uniref:NEDD8 ultimate buster 1-like isoform X2 n=1 Tax=Varroa jacobsoni TaxID=62625 RepID=UPI000BF4743F|nr:NEDD8 ultimate buster 1-like isoform X2 [Varroa jacobsoni]
MRFEQESDPRVSQIAKYLRNQNISLWEEPFWHNGETNIAQELVDSIATACHLPAEVILPILVQLQQHALERLEDRKLYSEQKLLTIRVKIGRVEHAVRMPETQSSSKLFDEVADLADTEASRVRLVHQGKMLPNDSTPLCMHNVKQNAKMTALVVSTDVEANLAEEITLNRRKKDVEGTRKTATMAAAIGRCEITNQFGVKVLSVKGSATNELTQLTRLQLLKGVAAFYKANYGEAKCFFEKANGYLKRLHVDEDLISQLINLGYTTQEARLALRQANNNIELAMNLLLNKQEQRDKEQRRWEDEQTNKHLQGVNRVLYDRLLSDLGVTAYVARKALLETGNDYRRAEALAIELENDRQAKKRRREETAEEQESSFAPAASSSGGCSVPHPKHVAELIAMGESEESAKYILEFFKGDLDAAQNFLLTGTDSQGSRLNKLISDLRRFVSNETDDYLDSTLEKETECFNTFTLRLAEIESTSKGVQ